MECRKCMVVLEGGGVEVTTGLIIFLTIHYSSITKLHNQHINTCRIIDISHR